MKKILILLIAVFLCVQAYSAELRFAQVTDVHLSLDGKNQTNSRDTSKTKKVLTWAVRSLNNKQPQFVVFMGDNIDKSEEDSLLTFLDIVKDLRMPYYIMFGNHDAHENGGIKKEDFWKIVKKHNKNNTSKYGYYAFAPNKDFLCIVLDGSVPFSPTAHGIFDEKELKWLDKTLKKNQDKKVLIFQHFPLIDPDDNPTHTLLKKDEYRAVLDKYDNIISISSGHFHKTKLTIDDRGIYHISTPALVTPDYVYDMITIDYKKLPFQKVKINEIKVTPIDLQ